MKKILLITLAAIILLSFSVQTLATTETSSRDITPMWTYIMNISAYLKISSTGNATCSSDMLQRSSDNSSELVMKLQKLNSDKWTTVATWTKKGSMESSNLAYKDVTKGTYRLSVTGNVYNDSGTLAETTTIYSTIETH
jgi:5-hydroxyisourate hydrolase-like protein (transthyretin family)